MKNRKLWVSILAGILAVSMILGFLAAVLPVPARAASSDELKTQLDDLKGQRDDMQSEMEELESKKNENLDQIEQVMQQKNNIEQQIALLYAQIENSNQQISTYNLMIADKQAELDAAEARLSKLNEKNKERIRAMEEDGALSYWSVLFKANDFSDLLDWLNMIQEIAAADKRRLKEMSEVAERIAAVQEELVTEKDALEVVRAEQTASQTVLDGKRAELDVLIHELVSRGEEYEALIAVNKDKITEKMNEIAEKEAEYDEAKQREWEEHMATATTAPAPPSDIPNREPQGGWLIPCDYVFVSDPYGWRTDPITGTRSWHSGIDLAAYLGTPIYATRSGRVTKASYDEWNGNHVVLNHFDGFSSVYLHMTHYVVDVNQDVVQGQLIGYVGSTGRSTGPHLHFTLNYNGSTVNPADYMTF